MKNILFSLLIIFYSNVYSQNFTFIISVDEKVNPDINNLYLLSIDENGKKERIEIDYMPGKISFKEKNYKKLVSKKTTKLFLVFYSTEFRGNKQIAYNYKIPFNKNWLSDNFFILYIYNTGKKKYRKVFTPLPDKEYTFEYDFPNGFSMRRIRKKV